MSTAAPIARTAQHEGFPSIHHGLESPVVRRYSESSSASTTPSNAKEFTEKAMAKIEAMKEQIERSVSRERSPQAQPPIPTKLPDVNNFNSKTGTVKMIIKPPPAVKLEPANPQGKVVDSAPLSEEEEFRRQYNKRPPWDKTPLWRPMSRDGAQQIMALAKGQTSPTASPPRRNQVKALSPMQLRAVSLGQSGIVSPVKPSSGTLSGSASPLMASPYRTLSPTESLGLSLSNAGSPSDEFEEERWCQQESTDMLNTSLLRPAGRNLLVTHVAGETVCGMSPRKRDEQQKQFARRQLEVEAISPLHLRHSLASPPHLRPSTTSSAISSRVLDDEDVRQKNWLVQRQQQRRLGHFAAKILGGTPMAQATDATGGALQYIASHRKIHEAQ